MIDNSTATVAVSHDRGSLRLRRVSVLWLSAAAVSGGMVAGLVSTVGLEPLRAAFRDADRVAILLAASALAAANLPHAARLQILLAPRVRSGFLQRLALTLRYGLYVVILPARLGEVAYIVRLRRELRLSSAISIAITMQQRLLDLIVIGCLALMAAMSLASALVAPETLVVIGGLVITAAVVITVRLPRTLAMLARMVLSTSLVPRRWRRGVLVGLLQARRWAGDLGGPRAFLGLLSLTAFEWALNIAGIVLIVLALDVRLPLLTSAGVAAVVLVAGAVPIHTIGGIGVVEAGLTGALYIVGVPLEVAVGVALTARVVLFGVPVLLWAPAAAISRLSRRRMIP